LSEQSWGERGKKRRRMVLGAKTSVGRGYSKKSDPDETLKSKKGGGRWKKQREKKANKHVGGGKWSQPVKKENKGEACKL